MAIDLAHLQMYMTILVGGGFVYVSRDTRSLALIMSCGRLIY